MQKFRAHSFVGLCIFFSILSGCAADSLAGNLQTITSLSDLEGTAFKNKTRKEVLNSFSEYPISKKASIGAITQASHISSNRSGSESLYALNSLEFFNRYKLLSYDKIGVTMHNSYKPSIFSIYNENKYLALMPRQDDYELRFLIAYNMKDRLVNTVVHNDQPYFSRLEFAYRKKFSNPFDQMRFALLAGVKINKNFSFLLQDNIDWNVRSKATATDNSYSNLGDFRSSKDANNMATFSLMYHFKNDMALQFGYVRRLHGNNPFYDNQGVVVGLWNSF